VIATHVTASLLPYLKRDGSFFIEIDADLQNVADQKDTSRPFLVMNDSDPFSCLIKAKISTKANSDVRSVFLLVQKDQYNVKPDSLWPLKNKDVEDAWQKLFTSCSKGHHKPKPILLKEQISESGGLLPMAPLFYCISRKIFFSPLCPVCAQPLQMCIDDMFLEKCGLQPHTKTLSRYLYCASCSCQSDDPIFYVPPHCGNKQSNIKDMSQLLNAYGQAVDNVVFEGNVPCATCQEINGCFGAENKAGSRIAPFSFFPFFMLMFPAATISAVDFLHLTSGASIRALVHRAQKRQDSGRAYCLSSFGERFPDGQYRLFDDNDKTFHEILYLKLSFLSELIDRFFPNLDSTGFLDLGLSIDRIWVRLADQNRLLPLLWNYDLEYFGVGSSVAVMPKFPKHDSSNTLHFVGSVWFYTLLVNQSQNIEKVFEGIGNILEDIPGSGTGPFDHREEKTAYMFLRPENIFWDPAGRTVNATCGTLWDQTLELGLSLLRGSFGNNAVWSADAFYHSLGALRSKVKKALFQVGEVSKEDVSSRPIPIEKREVGKILANILKEWRVKYKTEVQKKIPPSEVLQTQDEHKIEETDKHEEDADIYETVIISADKFQKDDHAAIQPPNSLDGPIQILGNHSQQIDNSEIEISEEVDSQETIIVAENGSEKKSSQFDEGDKDLPETMIFSEFHKSENGSPFDRQIISDRGGFQASSASVERKNSGEKESVAADTDDDLLEKTILQHTKKKG